MQVDAREILFIRKNAPHGMLAQVARNIGWSRGKVMNELTTLKEDYTDSLIVEARRLLEANTGLVYNPNEVAA